MHPTSLSHRTEPNSQTRSYEVLTAVGEERLIFPQEETDTDGPGIGRGRRLLRK